MVKHNIRLIGSGMKGSTISAVTLHGLLEVFVDGSRQALRLRTEGRSIARGIDPAWLIAAADFEIIQLCTGSTQIGIESPSIIDAAPDRFSQQNAFWRSIDVNHSAFQMFEDTLADAISGKADSDLFDDGLLNTCAQLSSLFDRGVGSIEITNGSPLSPRVSIDRSHIEQVAKLRRQTPLPRVAKVAGTMDMIRHSDKGFELVLESGETIRGIAQELDSEQLQPHFGKKVLITGKAVFRPSGKILRIEASKIEEAESSSALWKKAPRPIEVKFDKRQVYRAQDSRSGMNKVFGAWPGDETDEELRELMG